MSAAAKRTALAAVSVALLGAVTLAGSAGGAPSGTRDRVPPSPPANLHVTWASQSAVSTAWDEAQDDVGVAGYYVYGETGRATVSSPAYTVQRLECGESTAVSVSAFDRSGNRSPRVTTTVSTAACPDLQPPSTPSGFVQLATSQSAVVLAWNASTDSVGVVGYGVYRNLVRVASPAEPTVTLSGLACGSSTAYQVDAVDAAGNRSPLGTAFVQTGSCSDAQPPTAPGNLAVTSRTATSLSLAWSASSDDVGVAGYRVSVGGAPVATVTQTSATVSNLSCGTTYPVSVDAFDAAGNRSTAATMSAATDACPSPPPPSGDTTPPSTPTGLAASSVSQTGLTLTWNAASDNVGVTGYDVYRSGTTVATVSSTSSAQAVLSCGTSYPFAVVARDAAGNSSQPAQLSASTSACSSPPPPPADTTPPSQPTNLGISSVTRTSVSLTWGPSTDNVGVAGYRTYVNGSPFSTSAQPGATVSNLTCGTAYTFEVDAYDAAGNRSPRASVIGSTATCPDAQPPTAPTNVVATSRTSTSIALSWSPSSDNVGVSGYGLYRGGTQVGTSAGTTGIFSGLTCNTNYTLAVDAYDAAGNRSSQTVVMVSTTACPDTTPPSTPTGLAASNVLQTGLTLTWNASSDNVGVTGYDVYRNGTKMATVSSTTSSQTGLACGTSYSFAVVALDAAGNSSQQAQLTVSTSACPPPPPAPGTVIDSFDDTTTPWTKNLINRWQPVGGDHWSGPTDSGTPWSSSGGTWQVSTPQGPGFKMVVTPEMTVPSGGKTALIADIDHLVQGEGYTEDWSGMVMFPAAGNPNGFPRNYPDWGLFWEFHSQLGVPAQMGIDTTEAPYRNHIYVKSMGRKQLAPSALEYDRWYSWRILVKWSSGSDGLFEWWLDGVKLASWTGPNLAGGESPYLQFGFYGSPELRNEVWHAQIRRA